MSSMQQSGCMQVTMRSDYDKGCRDDEYDEQKNNGKRGCDR